jgi:hypothetical protein
MTRAINVLGVISPRPTVVTTHGKVCTVSYFLCQSVIVFGSIPLKCSRPSEQNIMNSTIATLDKTIKGVASPKQTSELFGSSLVLLLHINFTFWYARFDSIKHRVHFLAIFSTENDFSLTDCLRLSSWSVGIDFQMHLVHFALFSDGLRRRHLHVGWCIRCVRRNNGSIRSGDGVFGLELFNAIGLSASLE